MSGRNRNSEIKMEGISKLRKGDNILNLKKEYENNKLVIGPKISKKLMKKNKIVKLYLSTNAPMDLLGDIGVVEIEHLNVDAIELGKSLGKNFPISVLGVLK